MEPMVASLELSLELPNHLVAEPPTAPPAERRTASRPGVALEAAAPTPSAWHQARRADLKALEAEFRSRRDAWGATADLRAGWDEAISAIRRAMEAHQEAIWACQELDAEDADARSFLATSYETAMRAVAERTTRRAAMRDSVIRPTLNAETQFPQEMRSDPSEVGTVDVAHLSSAELAPAARA